jgi:hypothetical protein
MKLLRKWVDSFVRSSMPADYAAAWFLFWHVVPHVRRR